jgi:hypothetical protein
MGCSCTCVSGISVGDGTNGGGVGGTSKMLGAFDDGGEQEGKDDVSLRGEGVNA